MKNKKFLRFLIISSLIFIIGIVVDQLTKIWASQALANTSLNVLGSWLKLIYVENTGSSFGMLKGQNVLFFIVTLLGFPLFSYLWWESRNRSFFSAYGFALVLSGTIGNAIDRAFLGDGFFNGAVRDFISVQNFAVFNVADSLLVVGVAMAALGILFFDNDAIFSRKGGQHDR